MSKLIANAAIWFDGQAIASSVNQISIETSADMVDVTTMADSARRRLGGLQDSTISASGFWDAAEPDNTIFGDVSTPVPITIGVSFGAAGNTAYVLKAMVASYAPNGNIGAALGFSVKGAGTDGIGQGVIALNGTVTTTGSSAVYQLPAIPAGGQLITAIHISAASGTTPSILVTVKSANNVGMAGATTRATFTSATAVGSQYLAVIGPITDTFWRVDYTVAGTTPSFTIAAPVAVAF